MTAIPRAASTLLVALERDGWTVPYRGGGTGLDTATGLGTPRGNGTRPRVELLVEVDSYGLRAEHPDGRGIVALWIRRTEPTTPGKRPGWTLDSAWRVRRPDEHAPKQLTATELKAYTAPPTTEETAA